MASNAEHFAIWWRHHEEYPAIYLQEIEVVTLPISAANNPKSVDYPGTLYYQYFAYSIK